MTIMKTKFLPPTDIFDVLHLAEVMGIVLPQSVDDWWAEETEASVSEIEKKDERRDLDSQLANSGEITEKQRAYLVKLVHKYRRQIQ